MVKEYSDEFLVRKYEYRKGLVSTTSHNIYGEKIMSDKIGSRAEGGKYVSADFNQGGQLIANRDEIRDWETFELIKRDGNKIGLRVIGNNTK
jgi:hypothetical protein